MKVLLFVGVVFIILQPCLSLNDTHYTAGVIEYYYPAVNSTLTSEERTIQIVKDYMNLLEGSSKSLDIAVFPESTITTGINTREDLVNLSPEVVISAIPCENSGKIPQYFKELSCAAQKFNSYLIVNIVEKSLCTQEPCASDNYNLYNSNVAFDRNGKVIARYRKFHLFGEFQKNTTETADLTVFTTDFGVTFGTFICFDILFEEPPLWLTRGGVKHIVFPTMWFSEAPFLTALQVQNMFAVTTNSVVLASGANNPRIGSGGSGVFTGVNGPQNIGIIGEGGSKIFVADVPKDNSYKSPIKNGKSTEDIDRNAAKLDNFYLKRDKLEVYNSFVINDDVDSVYCHEGFCCKFEVKLSKKSAISENYYRYRIFVYSGVRSFDGVYNGGIEVCAVAFCGNDSVESCGRRIYPYGEIEWITSFESIKISGVFDDINQKVQYPNSLLSDLEPLDSRSYKWESDRQDNWKIQRNIELVTPQERLLTFGIYGRDFTRDSAP